jgi:sec-independent protein translocase protein TatB
LESALPSFTELLLVSIIAILFLGPDKLPEAMIQIAKFIKSVKKTVDTAKSSLDEELKIGDLKEEALNYKKQLDSATSELKSFKNIDFDDIVDYDDSELKSFKNIDFDDIVDYDDDNDVSKNDTPKKESPYTEDKTATQVEPKSDTVTFKKKSKKKKEAKVDDVTDETKGDA